MQISNLKGEAIPSYSVSLFEEISEHGKIGFIIRDFLSAEEIDTLLKGYREFNNPKYEIFPGFTMMPRSFEYVLNAKESDYKAEIDHMENNHHLVKLKKLIADKFKIISQNSKFDFASRSNAFSHSNGWSSFRELQPNNSFEIHCGNVFRYFSEEFFDFQYKFMDTSHFSYFVMLQKPENKTAITIYEPHFNQLPTKITPNTFKDVNGTVFDLKDIPRFDVNLNVGDIILFDESNYWHEVAKVEGNKNRITFGGFVSKFKDKKEFLVWT